MSKHFNAGPAKNLLPPVEGGLSLEGDEVPPEVRKRLENIMEARHKNALIAMRIEQLIFEEMGAEYKGIIEEAVEIHDLRVRITTFFEGLDFGSSKSGKSKSICLQEGIDWYFEQRKKARMIERRLVAQNNLIMMSLGLRSLGDHMFSVRVQSKNKGEIIAERRGAYFLVLFSDERDYNNFTNTFKQGVKGQYQKSFQL